MTRFAYPPALVVAIAVIGCSGQSVRDTEPLDDIEYPEAGVDAWLPDGGGEQDGDEGDADVLVPNDADRDSQGGQCVSDEDCADWLSVGPCQRAACDRGLCIKDPFADGTPCDDGNACTIGDVCKAGSCTFERYSSGQPGCGREAEPGSIWFTEIMGNPAAVPGKVHAMEGQWIELRHRGDSPVRLGGLELVYYEWSKGAPEPPQPTPVVAPLAEDVTDEVGPTLLLRSQEKTKNGMLSARWSYSDIVFSKTNSARLLLVKDEWDGAFPIPENVIVDEVVLEGGVFADSMSGRSWQLAAPFPIDSAERHWCHSVVSAGNEYVDKNYGTPRTMNEGCDSGAD